MHRTGSLPRPASYRECKRRERARSERRDSGKTFASSLNDSARSDRALKRPRHPGEFVRSHSTRADDRSFVGNGSSGRETYRRSSYPSPDCADDSVLDDIERFIKVFASMHRRYGGAEANLILGHYRIIDRRQEQTTTAHLTAEIEEQLPIGSDHDRYDKGVGGAGVDADLIEDCS